MTLDQVTEICRSAVLLALMISAPVLTVAVLVGLGISIIQAVTQIQDQTVSIIDDDHAAASFEWPEGRLIDHSSDRIHLDRPGLARLDQQHIGMDASLDPLARPTRAARVRVRLLIPAGQCLTVEQLSHRERQPTFADAIRSREDETRRQGVTHDGPRDQLTNRRMPRDVAQSHRERWSFVVNPARPARGQPAQATSPKSRRPEQLRDVHGQAGGHEREANGLGRRIQL